MLDMIETLFFKMILWFLLASRNPLCQAHQVAVRCGKPFLIALRDLSRGA